MPARQRRIVDSAKQTRLSRRRREPDALAHALVEAMGTEERAVVRSRLSDDPPESAPAQPALVVGGERSLQSQTDGEGRFTVEAELTHRVFLSGSCGLVRARQLGGAARRLARSAPRPTGRRMPARRRESSAAMATRCGTSPATPAGGTRSQRCRCERCEQNARQQRGAQHGQSGAQLSASLTSSRRHASMTCQRHEGATQLKNCKAAIMGRCRAPNRASPCESTSNRKCLAHRTMLVRTVRSRSQEKLPQTE